MSFFVLAQLLIIFGTLMHFNHTNPAIRLQQLLIACLFWCNTIAQPPSISFHQISSANGLSDPVVRSITQDKYGYIWIAGVNGLNRFNGYDVKVFQHIANDSFSLGESFVGALLTDREGNFWVAQSGGIYKYDYDHARFIFQTGSKNINATKMLEAGKNEIYLATNNGLVLFNTSQQSFCFLHSNGDDISRTLLSKPVNDFCIKPDGHIYIATDTGLIDYIPATHLARIMQMEPVKERSIDKIAVDKGGNFWASYGNNSELLIRFDERFSQYQVYRQFLFSRNNLRDNRITSILTDTKGRLWLTTSNSGLCLYDTTLNYFVQYEHDPLQSMSISNNLTTLTYQDRQGYIWVGTEGDGVNYFHPDRSFFHSIQPSYIQTPTLPDYWCRAAGEDKDGNLWLGTAGGVARYDPVKQSYKLFQNTNLQMRTIQYNSVRSILCNDDQVWIGTARGLNRYHISTGKMDFLGARDSVPDSFYWTIMRDHLNNIWFGCRDGIYRYNQQTRKTESLRGVPALRPYCNYNTVSLFEDHQGNIWIGFYSNGLLRYNPQTGGTTYWTKNDNDPHALSDNRVLSIKEDRVNIIWVATLDGLNAYDPVSGKFTQYLRGNGMPSERTSSLMVDNRNRIWLAANKGLLMLDSSRNAFKPFGKSTGLLTEDFNTQSAFELHNGHFIYPTLKGFVEFNPDDYSQIDNPVDLYISSFRINGNEQSFGVSLEENKDIHLKSNENYFSLQMVALNYGNPQQNWYAHKLEPFDKDWIYTRERLVSYTKIPGGDYTFRFKTSSNINNWNVPEKAIRVYVATVYYKTWWFILSLIMLFATILYMMYRWRINHKEGLHSLQTKANSLEKEKVLVMYESLKQQLNPHFLFNSLTSLSGLITSNPVHAKQFLDKMSKIYRYILKSRDNETVPLIEEIKLAETYTQLQQTRFSEGLQVMINIPEEYMHLKIAPVTLQNLIENAIKHNVIDKTTPLLIEIFVEENWIVVRNNLQKKSFVETSNKQGLANMQSLYHYLTGRPLVISEGMDYFKIKIPLI